MKLTMLESKAFLPDLKTILPTKKLPSVDFNLAIFSLSIQTSKMYTCTKLTFWSLLQTSLKSQFLQAISEKLSSSNEVFH